MKQETDGSACRVINLHQQTYLGGNINIGEMQEHAPKKKNRAPAASTAAQQYERAENIRRLFGGVILMNYFMQTLIAG